MAYASWSVVFGEQPSAAKWNILGTNDASFNDGTGIANLSWSTTAVSNPYKFSAYRTGALNSSNSYTKVAHDTESFDTNNNFDSTTNNRYTAPVSGFYVFIARASDTSASATSIFSALYVNGTRTKIGDGDKSASGVGSTVMALLQLSASDYVEHYFIGGSGSAMDVGADSCYFMGYLFSRT